MMERDGGRRRLWLGVAAVLLIAAMVALKLFVVDLYTIPQNGMYPGQPQGSRLLALKRPFRTPADVQRGDVIVFTRSISDQTYQFVWRVIGLPGDAIDVHADTVTVNGHALPHERVRTDGGFTIYRETNGDAAYEVAYHAPPSQAMPSATLTVPAGEFFVLGDNRDDARDSRFDGTVPFASIVARKIPR